MTDTNNHIDQDLQEWLDGRLEPAKRAALEAHLAGCLRCARLRSSLERSRAALRSASASEEVASAPLRARVLAALDAEDLASTGPPPVVAASGSPDRFPGVGRTPLASGAAAGSRRIAGRRPWLAGAAAAAAVVLFTVVALVWQPWARPSGGGDAVAAIEASLAQLEDLGLAVELKATEPEELERRFAARGLPFRPRVLDLAMMGLALAGGSVSSVGEEPSAATVYRRVDTDAATLCVMYRGRLADLPAADQVTRRGDFVFHVFRRGTATLVFWEEGDLVCVLADRGDPRALLELAAAKAMLVPAAHSPRG